MEPLNFLLKLYKPGHCHLLCPQHSYLPSSHSTVPQARNTQWLLLYKVLKSFHNSAQNNMVRAVTALPHSWYQLVLVRVTAAVTTHCDQKASMRGKGLLDLYFYQGRNPNRADAGADAEAMEEHCLLAFSPWFAQPHFLKHPGPTA